MILADFYPILGGLAVLFSVLAYIWWEEQNKKKKQLEERVKQLEKKVAEA